MTDSSSPVITLDNVVSAKACEAILTFCYLGACTVPEALLLPLLEAASWLQVMALRTAIIDALASRLSADNAVDLWHYATRFTLPSLAAAALDKAATEFGTVLEGDAFLSASHAMVTTLLESERLSVDSEVEVFRAVSRWADHQPPPGVAEADLMAMLRHVRFGCLPSTVMQNTVRAWPRIQSPAGQALLLDAMVPFLDGVRPAARRRLVNNCIQWTTHHSNMTISTTPESGDVTFYRTQSQQWDSVCSSEVFTGGRHSWTVDIREVKPFVGFGVVDSESDFAYRLDSAWRSSACAVVKTDGSVRGTPKTTSSLGDLAGKQVQLDLDMDARTLSVKVGTNAPKLVFPKVPLSVKLCVCSGTFYDPGITVLGRG